MATLKDVARETGLSVTTVSRVLNKRGYISEKTVEKVNEAMKKLNYQPNEMARALSRRSSNTIGVIMPHLDHPYFSMLLSHLDDAACEAHYRLLVFKSKGRESRTEEYLDICNGNRVAGIILCSGHVRTEVFGNGGIPLITMERFMEHGTSAVECDNFQGGRLAARHLIGKGCKRLLAFTGVRGMGMPADQRVEGFRGVCRENGVEYWEVPIDPRIYDTLEYGELIEQELDACSGVDGIFAGSDVIAAQVIQVCSRRNISIPGQMKVVGFDDTRIASLTTPGITTIHQPVREMAHLAVSLIASARAGEMVPSRTVLPVTLVERGTT